MSLWQLFGADKKLHVHQKAEPVSVLFFNESKFVHVTHA